MAAIELSNVIAGAYGNLRNAGVPTGTTQVQAATGQLLLDTTNGVLYENKGVPGTPNWVKVGA